ncbi:MAG: NTP/NDP exchange transporter Npt1 [Chlamydiales bacterium]
MSTATNKEFGKWRSMLWPVHGFELKKLLPMFLLLFFILFNYTILRDTKDTLIVTSTGPETITFLKFWGVMPMAIFFVIIYSKMSNILSKPALFYATIVPFIAFFALFATVLYPNREFLHPTELCDKMQAILPLGFKGFIDIFRHWTLSLFYVMSEMWGSMALSLLFWGFANDITKVSESKRFYSLFAVGGNVAPIASGFCIILCSDIRNKLPAGADAWQMSLNLMMALVVVAGFCAMGVYWWINKNVLTDERFYDQSAIKQKKEKPKMSIKESFAYLCKSKYIGCIAMIVICYGIAINLCEITFKSQLKAMFPNPNDYSTFMGRYSMMTGALTIFMALFVGSNVIRRFGWKVGALFTPVALAATCAFFFSFVLFKGQVAPLIAFLGTTPLMLAVIFGTGATVISKSAKYTLFDPTKEMAYIPLDQEQKVKGKAAIDVVGARLGKSGGSLIQQGLLIPLHTVSRITPYVAGILAFIILVWMASARALSKRFNALTSGKEEAPAAAAKAPQDLTPEKA